MPALQYPEQAAALVDHETLPPEELEPAATAIKKSLPLSPPSSDPSAEQRARLTKPLASGAASLGIVLGLFLLVVLVMRRGMPKGATSLPHDVVEVLGRAPLVGRQQVHLVRCANKVLLVCVSPTSAQTLTEITDPHEVEQLLIACRGSGAAAARVRQDTGTIRRSDQLRFARSPFRRVTSGIGTRFLAPGSFATGQPRGAGLGWISCRGKNFANADQAALRVVFSRGR